MSTSPESRCGGPRERTTFDLSKSSPTRAMLRPWSSPTTHSDITAQALKSLVSKHHLLTMEIPRHLRLYIAKQSPPALMLYKRPKAILWMVWPSIPTLPAILSALTLSAKTGGPGDRKTHFCPSSQRSVPPSFGTPCGCGGCDCFAWKPPSRSTPLPRISKLCPWSCPSSHFLNRRLRRRRRLPN
jgi:hypothetical protein